jgi:hypothetical protein
MVYVVKVGNFWPSTNFIISPNTYKTYFFICTTTITVESNALAIDIRNIYRDSTR